MKKIAVTLVMSLLLQSIIPIQAAAGLYSFNTDELTGSGDSVQEKDADPLTDDIALYAEERQTLLITEELYNAADNIASGKVNDITWVIDANGKLYVEGNGDYFDGYSTVAPWYTNREEILSAVVNVTGATTADRMFSGCSSLSSIDLSGFDVSNVTHSDKIFDACFSLVEIHTPLNLGLDISLPVSLSEDPDTTWYDPDGEALTLLPKGLRECVKLSRKAAIAFCTVEDDGRKSYTVTFDTNGGCLALVSITSTTEEGEKLSPPTISATEGYTLLGWYRDLEFITEWNFDTDTVAEDITLYAKWEVETPGENTGNSGNCGVKGDNVVWTLNDGVLTLSGSGDMKSYYSYSIENKRTAPWYSRREEINEIIVEHGITSIGSYAFWECGNLTNVVLPEELASIGDSAFKQCTSLRSIVIPAEVSLIGPSVFSKCTNLESVILPDGLSSIGDFAFANCSSLGKIVIPDSVTELDSSTFMECTALDDVTLPKSLTKIGSDQFSGCKNLRNIVIPDSVKAIGIRAFENTALVEATLPVGMTVIEGRMFSNCSALAKVTLPEGVTSIGHDAFSSCISLEKIVIPDSVITIGDDAFSYCDVLTEIKLSEGLTDIGASAFYNCKSLKEIVIPDSVTTIGDDAFSYCDALTEIKLSEGLTDIGAKACYNCKSLQKIVIPDSVATIGDSAFSSCEALTEVILPEGLVSIGEKVFYNCLEIKKIVIPKSVTTIGNEAFSKCKALSEITLPEGLTSIGEKGFEFCKSLEEIVIPDSVTFLGKSAFSRCTALGSVQLSQGLTNLPYRLFAYCENLQYIDLPSGIKTIEEYVFDNCGLWLVGMPSGVTTIAHGAFWFCPLERILYAGSEMQWGQIVIETQNEPILQAQILYQTTFTTTYRIHFDTQGGLAVADNVVGILDKLDKPADPVRDGYHFLGWYRDASCRELYNFDDFVWNDFTIYAGWYTDADIPLVKNMGIEGAKNKYARSMNVEMKLWRDPIYYHLFWDSGSNTFIRADYFAERVIIEEFDMEYNLLGSWMIRLELPEYGGFYKGKDAYYLVCGQLNADERDDFEVVRVVKYNKDFVRVGAASLYGSEIFLPFEASCPRMDEIGDELVIHAGRLIYHDYQGIYHQTNMTIMVNTPAMEISHAYSKITADDWYGWYVSHSFNQFVKADGEKLVFVDHGDGEPRSVVMHIVNPDDSKNVTRLELLPITGKIGQNYTGVEVGGLECSETHYIVTGNTIDQENFYTSRTKNIFLVLVSKADHSVTRRQLTSYEEAGAYSASEPHFVKISNDLFAVLWGEQKLDPDSTEYAAYLRSNIVKIVFLDGEGRQLGDIQSIEGELSDCDPIVIDGRVTWYVTDNSLMHFCSFVPQQSGTNVMVGDFRDVSKPVESMTFPSGMTEIPQMMCYGWNNLRSVYLPDSVTKISVFSFQLCTSLETINIPDSVTELEGTAFRDCSSLYAVRLSKNLKKIASETFRNCASLPYIELSAGLTEIGENAFDGCKNLTSIVVPATVTAIGRMAFYGTSLKDVYYGGTEEQWKAIVVGNYNDQLLDARVHYNSSGVDALTVLASVPTGSAVKKETKIFLLCPVPEARIYYTLDGTEPTEQSILYTEPILIDRAVTIRAVAVKEGYKNSRIEAFAFDIEEDDEELLEEDAPESGIPDGLWIAAIPEMTYSGAPIKPVVRVYDGRTRLRAGKDYKISYRNNTKAALATDPNPPTVVITGQGNYSGTETQTFTIAKKDISDMDVIKGFTNAYALPIDRKSPALVLDVVYGKMTLKKNVDYTLAVKDQDGKETASYAAAGEYTLVIKGCGTNYTGIFEDLTFTVTDKVPVSSLAVGKLASVLYDGTAKMPEPVVKHAGQVLVKDVDYALSYEDNIKVGTGTVRITGMGRYIGTRKVHFSIAGYSLKKAKVKGFRSSVAYAGGATVQEKVYLTYKNVRLEQGVDYTVSYSNNLGKGKKASVTFTGMGKYTGTVTKTFKITAYNIAKDKDKRMVLGMTENVVAYSKGGAEPYVEVYDKDRLLVKGKDYTLIYKNNKKPAEGMDFKAPCATVKGKGNYTGKLVWKVYFTITEKDLSQVSVSAPDVVAGTNVGGFRTVPVLTDTNGKKLKAGTDYSKSYIYTYKNMTENVVNNGININREAGAEVEPDDIIPAGTVLCVRAMAKQGSNYTGATEDAEYRVVRKLLTGATVTVKGPDGTDSFTYTGKEITLDKSNLTVSVGGQVLDDGQYEILADTYQNNIDKGTASVKIRGTGDYGGTKTVKYVIGAKGIRWFLNQLFFDRVDLSPI